MTWDTPSFQFLESLQAPLLPGTTALAAVTLIAYLSGRNTCNRKRAKLDAKHKHEIERTTDIARQLDETANALRHELTYHVNHFAGFKRRLSEAYKCGGIESWNAILADADQMLEPTSRFANYLSSAYASIRQHFLVLESFVNGRSDLQPAVSSGSASWRRVEELVTLFRRGGPRFSIAVVGLDHSRPDLPNPENINENPSLSSVIFLIESFKLDTYFVVRYGHEDFAIVMPHLRLTDACEVGELVRRIVSERLSATVSCGIAEYNNGDNSKSLWMRARSALYSAKACGPNRQFVHTGQGLIEHSSSESTRFICAPQPEDGNSISAEATSTTPLASSGIDSADSDANSSDASGAPDAAA